MNGHPFLSANYRYLNIFFLIHKRIFYNSKYPVFYSFYKLYSNPQIINKIINNEILSRAVDITCWTVFGLGYNTMLR